MTSLLGDSVLHQVLTVFQAWLYLLCHLLLTGTLMDSCLILSVPQMRKTEEGIL